MTTAMEAVVTTLTAAATAAGTNIYPWGNAPDSIPPPFILYHRVPSSQENMLDGSPPPIDNTRMQIDCFGRQYSDAVALALQVQTAMRSLGFKNYLLHEQDMYEPDEKLNRVIQEYSIWNS